MDGETGNNRCKQASLHENMHKQAEKLIFPAKTKKQPVLTRFGKDGLDEKRDSLSTVSLVREAGLEPARA